MSIFTKAHDFIDWMQEESWNFGKFWKYKILRRHKEWPFIMSLESLAILRANTAMTKLFDRKVNIPENTKKEIKFFRYSPGFIIPTNNTKEAWDEILIKEHIKP